MRCRKARSYLSAFSNNELTGRKLALVRDHVATCAACRKEVQSLRSLAEATRQVPALRVSSDFNAVLLNRVARERFTETRTRAYFPKRAPLFGAPRLAMISSALVVVLALAGFGFRHSDSPAALAANSGSYDVGSDSSYLTVQRQTQHPTPVSLTPGWSFAEQLAKARRLTRLSHDLTYGNGFSSAQLASVSRRSWVPTVWRTPNGTVYLQVVPRQRTYVMPARQVGEDQRVY